MKRMILMLMAVCLLSGSLMTGSIFASDNSGASVTTQDTMMKQNKHNKHRRNKWRKHNKHRKHWRHHHKNKRG